MSHEGPCARLAVERIGPGAAVRADPPERHLDKPRSEGKSWSIASSAFSADTIGTKAPMTWSKIPRSKLTASENVTTAVRLSRLPKAYHVRLAGLPKHPLTGGHWDLAQVFNEAICLPSSP